MVDALYWVRLSYFIPLLAVALYITFSAIYQLYKILKFRAQPDPERWGDWVARSKLVAVNVFGQKKLLKKPAGYGHLVIFYGFILITIISLEVYIRGIFPNFSFSFLGPVYDVLLWLEDILSVAVFIALIVGFLRRYILKPLRFQERLENHTGLNRDATIILFAIAIHIIFATLLSSLEIASGTHPRPNIPFFAKTIAKMWPQSQLSTITEFMWLAHALSVWLFLIYIFGSQIRVPRYYPSKHFHILSAAFNVAFGNLKPQGRLRPMATSTENFETLMEEAFDEENPNKRSFAVSKVEDLKWTQMLDLYSCTGCGRCQEVCPAYLSDQRLSPKALILNMRERLLEKATLWAKDENIDEEIAKLEETKPLIGGAIEKEMIWSCTTCNACQTACPVFIEHIDKIVDMRRHLSMIEADFPSGIDTIFDNIETNSNPWGIGKSKRDEWAKDLDLKLMKDYPDTEVLFWVGCAGSFDEKAKKVASDLVKILRTAGIDFAILGKEENCTGDPARRLGNEYLSMNLMTQNVELLNSYKFKEVITICPHCFNNLKNELPDFGGHYRVIHAVDYVNKLIKTKKITLKTSEPLNMTYHDSCYLGRHNGIYSAPREILSNFKGIKFIEMEMTKDESLCCGAGGGRIWYEYKSNNENATDINKTRIKMAERTGADKIGVSCPFCTIMLEDGIKNLNSKMEVIDLMEIVANRI